MHHKNKRQVHYQWRCISEVYIYDPGGGGVGGGTNTFPLGRFAQKDTLWVMEAGKCTG